MADVVDECTVSESQPVTVVEKEKVKRNRNKNFTLSEEETILVGLERDKKILTSKFNNNIYNRTKNKLWQKITDEVNAISTVPREMKDIKKKWEAMQYRAKNTEMLTLKEQRKTGGGPAKIPKEHPLDERIRAAMGETCIHGIRGGVDVLLQGNVELVQDKPSEDLYMDELENAESYEVVMHESQKHLEDSLNMSQKHLEDSLNMSQLTQQGPQMHSTPCNEEPSRKVPRRRKSRTINYNEDGFVEDDAFTRAAKRPNTVTTTQVEEEAAGDILQQSQAATPLTTEAHEARPLPIQTHEAPPVPVVPLTPRYRMWTKAEQSKVLEIEKERLELDKKMFEMQKKHMDFIESKKTEMIEIQKEHLEVDKEILKVMSKQLEFQKEHHTIDTRRLQLDEQRLDIADKRKSYLEKRCYVQSREDELERIGLNCEVASRSFSEN